MSCALAPLSYVRLINMTRQTVGGLGWLDDLEPLSSVGITISEWEMLKQKDIVKLQLQNKTIKADYKRE